jgi:hypothetical protein
LRKKNKAYAGKVPFSLQNVFHGESFSRRTQEQTLLPLIFKLIHFDKNLLLPIINKRAVLKELFRGAYFSSS